MARIGQISAHGRALLEVLVVRLHRAEFLGLRKQVVELKMDIGQGLVNSTAPFAKLVDFGFGGRRCWGLRCVLCQSDIRPLDIARLYLERQVVSITPLKQ